MPTIDLDKYVQHLDEQIKFHGMELEKHMNAREILMRDLSFQAMLRPTKIEPQQLVRAKPRKNSKPDKGAWARVRSAILQYIETNPDRRLKAGDFIQELLGGGPYDKSQRDRIYGVLKELRDKRKVVLNSDQSYTLMTAHPAAA